MLVSIFSSLKALTLLASVHMGDVECLVWTYRYHPENMRRKVVIASSQCFLRDKQPFMVFDGEAVGFTLALTCEFTASYQCVNQDYSTNLFKMMCVSCDLGSKMLGGLPQFILPISHHKQALAICVEMCGVCYVGVNLHVLNVHFCAEHCRLHLHI